MRKKRECHVGQAPAPARHEIGPRIGAQTPPLDAASRGGRMTRAGDDAERSDEEERRA